MKLYGVVNIWDLLKLKPFLRLEYAFLLASIIEAEIVWTNIYFFAPCLSICWYSDLSYSKHKIQLGLAFVALFLSILTTIALLLVAGVLEN